jgi:hypothetical protein
LTRSVDDLVLACGFHEPEPRLSPDEAERRVREKLAAETDDLYVAWQVVNARSEGRAWIRWIEHICLSPDCPHDYMMRLPGPLTREVAERIAAFKAERQQDDETMARWIGGLPWS